MADTFKEFERQLDLEQEREFAGGVLEITQRIAFDGLNGVVNLTPVDTGFAVNNWDVALGGEPAATEPTADPVAAGMQTINQAQPFQIIAIANGAEYIGALENGHSQQAPNGMVGVTLSYLESKYREVQ